jgi:hypothetical protein
MPIFNQIIVGATLSGVAPFIMTLANGSYVTVTLFVITMSVGEALWSPRLLEYSTTISPKGLEGTYLALGSIPQFLAKFLVGMSQIPGGHDERHFVAIVLPLFIDCMRAVLLESVTARWCSRLLRRPVDVGHHWCLDSRFADFDSAASLGYREKCQLQSLCRRVVLETRA